MEGNARSLAQGLVPAESTVLYECPRGSITTITLMDFANTNATSVTLNVWKRSENVSYRISPPDFIFGAKYLAQEDGTVTLQPSDQIIAQCNENGVVEYHINGFIKEYTGE